MSKAFLSLERAKFDLLTAEARLTEAQGCQAAGAVALKQCALDSLRTAGRDVEKAQRDLENELLGLEK